MAAVASGARLPSLGGALGTIRHDIYGALGDADADACDEVLARLGCVCLVGCGPVGAADEVWLFVADNDGRRGIVRWEDGD